MSVFGPIDLFDDLEAVGSASVIATDNSDAAVSIHASLRGMDIPKGKYQWAFKVAWAARTEARTEAKLAEKSK